MLHNNSRSRSLKSDKEEHINGNMSNNRSNSASKEKETKATKKKTNAHHPYIYNNEEIFKMQDLNKKEQEYKNKRLHPNVYLTEQKEDNFTDFKEKFQLSLQNKEKSSKETILPPVDNSTKTLQIISENKRENMKKNIEVDNRAGLNKKIDTLGAKKSENIRDFINKTREIVYMKHTVDMKKERIVRMKETYTNEIESIKDSIVSMQYSKKKFEEEFYERFEKYVKYLAQTKEKEKTIENDLLVNKINLEKEKNKQNTKIKSLESDKERLENYRDFLICVKEKKLKLPDAMNRKSYLSMASSSEFKDYQRTTTYVTAISNEMSKSKGASKSKYNSLFEKAPKRKNDDEQIFNSLPELEDEIKKMQKDNVDKLVEYNDIMNDLREAQKNLEVIRQNDQLNSDHIVNDLNVKETYLRELVDKHRKLCEIKKSIGGDISIRNTEKTKSVYGPSIQSLKSFLRFKINEPQLYSKIQNVYNMTINLQFTKNFDKISITVSHNETEKNQNMLIMLQYIERCTDILLENCKIYKTKDKDKLADIRANLEKERKEKKTREQKLLDKMKHEQKIKDIMKRDSKVNKLPKRFVPQRCQPIEDSKTENKDDNSDKKEVTFEDLISFD